MGVMVRKRSVPAVSQSCTFISFPCRSITFCLYYTPIVGVTLSVDYPMNLRNRLVLPTALSPRSRILQRSPSRMANYNPNTYTLSPKVTILTDIKFNGKASVVRTLRNWSGRLRRCRHHWSSRLFILLFFSSRSVRESYWDLGMICICLDLCRWRQRFFWNLTVYLWSWVCWMRLKILDEVGSKIGVSQEAILLLI